ESVLRVFDRYGERASRHKARIKFLIQKIGIDAFNELVKEQQKALTYQRYQIDVSRESSTVNKSPDLTFTIDQSALTIDPFKFEIWKKTNVYPQKQDGYFTVYVRILNGNISSVSSRTLIEKLRPVIADDVRITINQGLQFRFVKPEHLEYIYSALEQERS